MKKLVVALMAASGCILTSTAHAAVSICQTPNCASTNENVLVNSAMSVSTVTGQTNQTNAGITFTSPLGELLNGEANGQARVSAADGLLNGLTFVLDSGNTFSSAVFNLVPLPGNSGNQATSIVLTYFLSGGGTGSQTINIGTNGQNDTGIFGTAGEQFTGIRFLASNASGISDLRQLRLGGVAGPNGGVPIPSGSAVPEPSVWLMMLLGFGAMGFVLRRERARASIRLRLTN